jgi:hypothetical protein
MTILIFGPFSKYQKHNFDNESTFQNVARLKHDNISFYMPQTSSKLSLSIYEIINISGNGFAYHIVGDVTSWLRQKVANWRVSLLFPRSFEQP